MSQAWSSEQAMWLQISEHTENQVFSILLFLLFHAACFCASCKRLMWQKSGSELEINSKSRLHDKLVSRHFLLKCFEPIFSRALSFHSLFCYHIFPKLHVLGIDFHQKRRSSYTKQSIEGVYRLLFSNRNSLYLCPWKYWAPAATHKYLGTTCNPRSFEKIQRHARIWLFQVHLPDCAIQFLPMCWAKKCSAYIWR